MKYISVLPALVFLLLLILEIECKKAKNRGEFKNKLKYSLEDDDIEYNPDDIDIDEYCNFVDEYRDSKLDSYDADNRDELKTRYKLYKKTKENIKIWNKNAKKEIIDGKVFEEKYGITPFADMTSDETYEMMNGVLPKPDTDRRRLQSTSCVVAASTQYDNVDISSSNFHNQYCAPVKDQGQTSACWEFATTGEAECNINRELYPNNNPGPMSFNEQYVSDCTTPTQGTKFGGGFPDRAVEYLSEKGLCKTTDYDWNWSQHITRDLNGDCTNCKQNKYYSNCEKFDYGQDTNKLAKAAASHSWAFAMYLSESFKYLKGSGASYLQCTPHVNAQGQKDEAHAMVIVGNYNSNLVYVRNSWGTGWGDNGYVYMDVNAIAKDCFFPGIPLSRSYGFTQTPPNSRR